MDKIQNLKEIAELLKSGAISQEEFDKLKSELLNPQKQSEENPKLIELKELLESGVITQEEFIGLKNELLKSQNNSNENPSLIEWKEYLNSRKITHEEFSVRKEQKLKPHTQRTKYIQANTESKLKKNQTTDFFCNYFFYSWNSWFIRSTSFIYTNCICLFFNFIYPYK